MSLKLLKRKFSFIDTSKFKLVKQWQQLFEKESLLNPKESNKFIIPKEWENSLSSIVCYLDKSASDTVYYLVNVKDESKAYFITRQWVTTYKEDDVSDLDTRQYRFSTEEEVIEFTQNYNDKKSQRKLNDDLNYTPNTLNKKGDINNMENVGTGLNEELNDLLGINNEGGAPKLEKSDAGFKENDATNAPKADVESSLKGQQALLKSISRTIDPILSELQEYNTKHAKLVCLVARTDSKTQLSVKSFKEVSEGTPLKFKLKPNVEAEKVRLYTEKYIGKKKGVTAPTPSEIFMFYKYPMFEQKAPSTLEGAIIKMPKNTVINPVKIQRNSLGDIQASLKEDPKGDMVMIPLTRKLFASMLLSQFQEGTIVEENAEVFYNAKGVPETGKTSQIRAKAVLIDKTVSTEFMSTADNKGETKTEFTVKFLHNFRPKLFTKSNYIPLSVYKTYAVDTTKDIPEDVQAKIMNNEIMPKVINKTTADNAAVIDLVKSYNGMAPGIFKDDQGNIVNNFFATGEDKVALNVIDWYESNKKTVLPVVELQEKAGAVGKEKSISIKITDDAYPVARFNHIWDKGVKLEMITGIVADSAKERSSKKGVSRLVAEQGTTLLIKEREDVTMTGIGKMEDLTALFRALTRNGDI